MTGDARGGGYEASLGHRVAQDKLAAGAIGVIHLGTLEPVVLVLHGPFPLVTKFLEHLLQRRGHRPRGVSLARLVSVGRDVWRVAAEAVMDADKVAASGIVDVLERAPEPVGKVLRDQMH